MSKAQRYSPVDDILRFFVLKAEHRERRQSIVDVDQDEARQRVEELFMFT